MGLKSITIMPMGKLGGEDKEEAPKENEEEDGLREAFDEFKSAMDEKDDDAAFEALKNFCDMCAMKSSKDEYK
jgi:hypothetical protein